MKHDVIVRKNFPLGKDESVGEATRLLSKAARPHVFRKLNRTEKNTGAYVMEVFASAAVVNVYSFSSEDEASTNKYYSLPFTRTAKGEFEFGELTEVERVTGYAAIKKARDEDKPEDLWIPHVPWDGLL